MIIDNLQQALEKYHENIKDKFETAIANEHTLRTDLENLLNAFKPNEIKIFQEAKKEEYEQGTPDFKVFKRIDPKESLSYNLLIGYIETKKLNENLDKIRKSEQIKKYIEVSPNIILTDYNRFIHLSYDKVISDITLFEFGLDDKNKLFKNKITEQITIKFKEFLDKFFLNYEKRKIKSKKELVKVLSSQAFYLSVKTREVISNNKNYTKFKKFFNKTYSSFKEAVKYNFNIEEFCDIFAQSIAYGLFVAHIEGINIEEEIDLPRLLPREFDLLSEFIYFSAPSFNLPKEIEYAIENIKKTITLIDKEKVEKELGNNLSIYLYEDFLKEFDNLRGTEKRKEGGVFYTPEPVVKFIVKSVKQILKDKFDANGFKDEKVKVLDPATGTGSFLAEVFNCIIEDINSPVLERETVRKYFLNNIYGFELMFVPYIVAHLKLSHILKRKKYNLSENDRLNIFLTNTLDLSQGGLNLEMPLLLLEEECEKSRQIKEKENILVIIGNPPYNNKSKNKDEKILELLKTYKEGLDEKKLNLDDDYIKFIRFAQWKLLEQNKSEDLFTQNNQKSGLLSFITNNSFIWGRTHRKMRESLYKAFDEIYILNLHGGKDDPKNDKNIFDIQVGVCISIFVKYPEYDKEKKVYYYSTADNNIFSREEKFELLNNNNFKTIKWKKIEVKEPYYWFIEKDLSSEEYEENENFWSVDKIFKLIGSGNKSERDKITIHFTKKELDNVINDFLSLREEDIRKKYLLKDSRDWKIKNAQKDLKTNKGIYTSIAYRPFDNRITYFTGQSRGFWGTPSAKISKHLLYKNVGLLFTKSNNQNNFDASFITNKIVDIHLIGGQSYTAPLYLYDKDIISDGKNKGVANFTQEFIDFINTKPYANATPEEILAYIYAVLYHPAYRERYSEYLKIDFPKIPFTDDIDVFTKMVHYGKELIDLHLMEKTPNYQQIRINTNTNDYSSVVEKLNSKQRYKENENKIYINQTLFIEEVSEEIWEYKIGSYQVIDKWIKYRIGRELDYNDLKLLEDMVKIIKKTIEIQEKLERVNLQKLF